MTHAEGRLAILVGGGPAPGINSVIGAATIRARLAGVEVLGVRDGFKRIMKGDTSHVAPLDIDDVSRIHFRGGSDLGTARDNPARQQEDLERVVATLLGLGVDKLITIGGDDTAYSAMRVQQASEGRLRVAHVPKTIDNDLDLPHGIFTFGFQTARHVGVQVIQNLMVDARTTTRWYFVVSMGRKAGHLALGMAKAAGATLSLIPEEFPEERVRLQKIVDILVGAIAKRVVHGRPDGVAVLAEGLIEKVDPADLEDLPNVERDAHGHLRLSEVSFGTLIKRCVRDELDRLGVPCTIVAKDIGYELRCADPIPFDIEYTRDLGHCSAHFLLKGHGGALVSIQGGRFVPIDFDSIVDEQTGRMRVRMVDIGSESYAIARRYMIRLTDEDFTDEANLARIAAAVNMTPGDFRRRFEPLVRTDAWRATKYT
jgi:6-phosphofructokinase 1